MIRIPRVYALLLALGALAAAPASYGACTYPKAPASLPDGATAAKEDMLAGQKDVKQFMADMDVYLKCVDDESPPAAGKLTDEQKKEQEAREKIRVQKHNAGVADEEALRDRWHDILTAYQAKQAASK
jgi:hypothetical protein